MKKFAIGLGISALFLITGCTFKSSALVSTVDISKTNMKEVSSLKEGEACQRYFLFIPIGFDATAKTAAEKSNISKIKYQETSHTMFWPIYWSHCIKVYGE